MKKAYTLFLIFSVLLVFSNCNDKKTKRQKGVAGKWKQQKPACGT